VILFTCIAEISTVDEEPIFRILPLKLPFFQHSKKNKKTKKQKKEGQIKYPNQKQ
jgi:translation initiation factor IF-3